MTTLRISITKEVLEATKDCGYEPFNIDSVNENCAIAYAIRKIWPLAKVGKHLIKFDGVSDEQSCYHKQVEFIGRFDKATPAERAAMQPFSFDIEVPDEVIGEVNIEEIRRICEGSKTLEVV